MNYPLTAIDLPTAWGQPLITGVFKSAPADFVVMEQLGFDLDGQGEHLFVHVRKCGLNTNDVLEILQKEFKCRSVDIGVSGLKDKHAITDQWISVRSPINLSDTGLEHVSKLAQHPVQHSAQQSGQIEPGEIQILDAIRHNRKLRRGAHQENRFTVRLRDVQPAKGANNEDQSVLEASVSDRLTQIELHGFPNYFGPQRFGFNQQNLAQAQRFFANPRKKITRTKRGLYISAARSAIFNRVCAHRVQAKTWSTPITGEPMILDGAQSYFVNTDNEDETLMRCQSFDIHPSGPMWGSGDAIAQGECAQLENDAMASLENFCNGLASIDLKQQRRSLRVRPTDLQWEWLSPTCLELNFGLTVGSYATSMLAELVSIQQD